MSKALNTVTFGLAGKDKSDREKARDKVRRGQAPDPETGGTSRNIPFPGQPGDPRHKAKLAARKRSNVPPPPFDPGNTERRTGRGVESGQTQQAPPIGPVDISRGRRGTFTAPTLTEEAIQAVRRRGRRRAPTVVDLERISTLG